MLKYLLSFKVIIGVTFAMLISKFLFGRKKQPAISEKDLEGRIYRNVTKAIINGYNQAVQDEEQEERQRDFRGVTDDTFS